jgi:Xaa-Pro aminopeptidase
MLKSSVSSEFKKRRKKLYSADPGSVFIFPSAQELLRNPDVYFNFRQESNFYYLSGFDEPESLLVLAPKEDGDFQSVLFVRERNIEKEIWEGERYGADRAVSVFGMDSAFLVEEFDEKFLELLAHAKKVYHRLGQSKDFDERLMTLLEKKRASVGRSGKGLLPIFDPSEALGEMRLIKSEEEISLLRKAAVISAQAHVAAMKETRPGMNEAEVEALIDYVCRKNGCQRMGYGSIVAGGKNATTLHYRANNEKLEDGTLLLIDAGGEFDYYTADITRTFPVGKKFTEAQAEIYDLVLKVQKEAISMVKPGANYQEITDRAFEVLTEGLIELGLLKGNKKDLFEAKAYKRFCPHSLGHWLGMDVHDVGLYQKDGSSRPLEPGMVFTIEPGVYCQPGDQDVPERYRNIGIRIEDNILVTKDGSEVLTLNVPRERADIEN